MGGDKESGEDEPAEPAPPTPGAPQAGPSPTDPATTPQAAPPEAAPPDAAPPGAAPPEALQTPFQTAVQTPGSLDSANRPAWHTGKVWRGNVPILAFAAIVFALYAQNLDVTQVASREAANSDLPWDVPPLAWDEHYYVSVAHQQAAGVWLDPCWGERPSSWDHPPLAKMILTASVHVADVPRVFSGCRLPDDHKDQGYDCYPDPEGQIQKTGRACYQAFMQDLRENGNPYAWRLPSAVMGTLAVLGTALATRRILASTAAGVLAGSLVALDGMMFTLSRLALLDIFAAGFACLALWSATYPSSKGRIGAGVLLGLAFCCKYTALFTGLPILLVALWCTHRAGRLSHRVLRGTAAAVAGLPLAVWLLSFLPWWVTWIGGHGPAWAVGYFGEMVSDAFDWQATATIDNPSTSQPWEWFLLDRPVWFFTSGTRSIFGLPNPFVWWGGALASLGGLVWLRSAGRATPDGAPPDDGPRRPQSPGTQDMGAPSSNIVRIPGTPTQQAMVVCALLPALGYGGFLLLPRSSFLYYMAVIVPLLAIALAGFVWTFRRRPGPMAWLAGGLFLALFLPAAASFWHPEMVPGSAYLIAMLGTGAAATAAAVGSAFPSLAARAWRVSALALLVLAVATFIHQFPLLQGLPTDPIQQTDISRALPWALR